MDKVEKYKAAAQRWAAMYKVEDEHAITVASSILMTRDKIWQGGSFVQAVVDNNLREAINRADDTCIKYQHMGFVKQFLLVIALW